MLQGVVGVKPCYWDSNQEATCGVEEIIAVGGHGVALLGMKNHRKMRVKIHYAQNGLGLTRM